MVLFSVSSLISTNVFMESIGIPNEISCCFGHCIYSLKEGFFQLQMNYVMNLLNNEEWSVDRQVLVTIYYFQTNMSETLLILVDLEVSLGHVARTCLKTKHQVKAKKVSLNECDLRER